MFWVITMFVLTYLMGSFNFATIVSRSQQINIREVGSGNPGASNVFRNVGRGAALLVLVGDMLKGVMAAAVGWILAVGIFNESTPESTEGWQTWALVLGLVAVIGHCFPISSLTRGGKGVATSLGVVLWVFPLVALAAVAVWGLVAVITRMASVASISGVLVSLPLAIWWAAPDNLKTEGIIIMAIMSLLVIGRHYQNLVRLFRGQETRLGKAAREQLPDESELPTSP